MKLRVLVGLAATCLCAASMGYPEFFDVISKKYAFSPDSPAAKAKCGVCHVGGKPPKVNPFGADVKKNLGEDYKLTDSVLQKVALLDSDGDGTSNEDELNQGKLPGEPEAKDAPSAPVQSELVPKHSFHPAVSHFPLALWAVAALLELLRKRNKKESLHEAAVINLGLGLLGAIVTIATGIVAMLRLGYWPPNAQPMLFHLILMSASTLFALGAWTQRRKEGYTLLILLGLAAATVMVGGHFGGTMVYGG